MFDWAIFECLLGVCLAVVLGRDLRMILIVSSLTVMLVGFRRLQIGARCLREEPR